MKSCILILETLTRVAHSVDNEYVKICHDDDGWNVETKHAIDVHELLETALDRATQSLNERYPDPEEAERAEYERLRLKFGGAPLPEPKPPVVWVGSVWDGDSWDADIVFAKEGDADLWFADYPQHRCISRVPYHDS
jgi:hypothetical protein